MFLSIYEREDWFQVYKRRSRKCIKLDTISHMDERAEKKPREEAVKAFRHKAYAVDMGKGLDKLRSDVNG